jgi:hypothetical protein
MGKASTGVQTRHDRSAPIFETVDFPAAVQKAAQGFDDLPDGAAVNA